MSRSASALDAVPALFPLSQNGSIDYAVPFDWGELYVTRAASDAYGIVPLTAETVPMNDYAPAKASDKRRISVLISAEDDLSNGLSREQMRVAYTGVITTKRTIGVNFAFKGDKESAAENIMDQVAQISQMRGVSKSELLQQFAEQGEDPIKSMTGRTISQLLIHKAVEEVGEATSITVAELETKKANRRTLGAVKADLLAAVIAPAIMATLDVNAHSPLPATAATTALGAGLFSVRAYGDLKLHISSLPGAEARAQRVGLEKGLRVATDIHNIFCSDLFDAQFNSSPMTES
jgi:hypothetical protein